MRSGWLYDGGRHRGARLGGEARRPFDSASPSSSQSTGEIDRSNLERRHDDDGMHAVVNEVVAEAAEDQLGESTATSPANDQDVSLRTRQARSVPRDRRQRSPLGTRSPPRPGGGTSPASWLVACTIATRSRRATRRRSRFLSRMRTRLQNTGVLSACAATTSAPVCRASRACQCTALSAPSEPSTPTRIRLMRPSSEWMSILALLRSCTVRLGSSGGGDESPGFSRTKGPTAR
jgi:hypothetical protein